MFETKTEYYFFKDLERIVFIALVAVKTMCLVEAQSTWTKNILIRVILYYAKTLKEYIDEK